MTDEMNPQGAQRMGRHSQPPVNAPEQQAAEKTDAADGNTAAEDASGESFFDDNAK